MNPNYDNQNFQDNLNNIGKSSNDDNILNDGEDNNFNLNNQEMEYMTDSDIDDPKYMPTGNIIQNDGNIDNVENIPNFENLDNLDNLGVPSENQVLLQNQLMNLENSTMMQNKTVQQLENENDQIKEQLMKNKQKIQSKVEMNNQFKQLAAAFNQRFVEYEKRNKYLEQYINQLKDKLKKLDLELIESLKDKNTIESTLNNENIYKQNENELQNEFI